MRDIDWMGKSTEQRLALLTGVLDARPEYASMPWDRLPYWLRRYITYFL